MIINSITSLSKISKLDPNFKEAFLWIQSTDLTLLAEGKHIISGALFAIKQKYKTKPKAEGLLEAHKRYIDIQFLISGSELVYASNPVEGCEVKQPYSEEKDIMFYSAQGMDNYMHRIRLFKGNFAIFYPEDWHMPCILDEKVGSEEVEKIVIKIPVEA